MNDNITINITEPAAQPITIEIHEALDAYQIAVDQGFVGTRAQWLASFTAGPAGPTGSTGLTGPAGPAGQAATFTVGTTTTGAAGSNASVSNSGTSSAGVFNFTIPRGATGATGAQGPQGPASPVASVAGKTGAVTLVSADITDATSTATPNTLVQRTYEGAASFYSGGDVAVSGNSGVGNGLLGSTTSGYGVVGTAVYGTGANSYSTEGDYHHLFGTTAPNQSFVARVKGAFGWIRGAFTGRIQAADTLTANRTYTLPNASGTVALTSDIAVASVGGRTGAVTLASADITDATSANNGDALVKRDGIGNFSASDITAENNLFASGSVFAPNVTLQTSPYNGILQTLTLSSERTYNFPNLSGTVALTDVAQSWSGTQTFSGAMVFTNATASTTTTTGALKVTGGVGIQGAINVGGATGTAASTTTTAGLKVPHGAAPTSPVDGDVWTTTAGSFIRINGTTRQTATLSDNQSFSGNQTFAGTAAFTNTDRPTSSGSSAPVATSLMTRDDVDSAAFDNFGRILRVTNPTFSTAPVGGTSLSVFPHYIAQLGCGTVANGYARATMNRGLNQIPSITGGGIAFSQPISIAIKLAAYFENTTTKFRLIIGGNSGIPATADNDALSAVGYGLELAINGSNFFTIAAFAHNGTTFVKATPTVTSLVNSASWAVVQFATFTVSSNGSGTITAQYKTGRTVNSTSTTTGGPTTDGTSANGYVDAATVNGLLNAANTRVYIQDLMIKLY